MDLQFLWMVIKIIIFLPFILALIYLSMKYGSKKLQTMQNGKYIKVLERTPLSKENSLIVAKIGGKGYVLSSTTSKIDILFEMKEEELLQLETTEKIPEFATLKDMIEKFKNQRKDKDA